MIAAIEKRIKEFLTSEEFQMLVVTPLILAGIILVCIQIMVSSV